MDLASSRVLAGDPHLHVGLIKRLSHQTQVPVLQWQGEVIAGSANILDTLEIRVSDNPLYPKVFLLSSGSLSHWVSVIPDCSTRFDTLTPALSRKGEGEKRTGPQVQGTESWWMIFTELSKLTISPCHFATIA